MLNKSNSNCNSAKYECNRICVLTLLSVLEVFLFGRFYRKNQQKYNFKNIYVQRVKIKTKDNNDQELKMPGQAL